MGEPREPPKQIKVLYFGAAGTATGIHSEMIDLDLGSDLPSHSDLRSHSHVHTEDSSGSSGKGLPLAKLGEFLSKRHASGALGSVLKISKWAVNLEMVENEDVDAVTLVGGEEVRWLRSLIYGLWLDSN